MENLKSRDYSLDGLRGIAAACVVLFHFFCAFAPHLISGCADTLWRGSDTPLAIFYNGGFAVSIFFVLSGFVISKSVANSNRPLIASLAFRYLRLALPVTVSTLLAWGMLVHFSTSLHEFRLVSHSPWVNYVYDGNLPGIQFALYHGLIGVFREGSSEFNNVLWTMKIELLGSCLIYLIFWRKLANLRIHLLIACILISSIGLRPEYGAFAIGALFQEAHSRHFLPRKFGRVALCIGIFLGAMMEGYATRMGVSWLDAHLIKEFRLGEPHKFFQIFSASLVMYSALSSKALRDILSHKVFKFFGRISFGLYLAHVPIIYVFGSWLYFSLPDPGKPIVMAAAFIPVAVFSGYLFTIFVDEPIVSGLHKLNARFKTSGKMIRAVNS